jgi:glycosyltransferase involved in cell wall biosynthesis
MRIGIDIRHLAQPHKTGVGRYTIEVIHALAKAYPHNTFILFASATPGALKYIPDFSEVNILVEKHHTPSKILKLLLVLPLGITLEDRLYRNIDTWWLPNVEIFKTRLPYFLTVHDLTMEILGRTYSWKRRAKYWLTNPHQLMQGAQKLFCVSKSTAQDVTDLIKNTSNCVVTPLGVSRALEPRKQPYDGTVLSKYRVRDPYFLSLCTLEPRKNLESVIEGFSAWKKESQSNTKLVLAGISGWKDSHIRKLVETSNDIVMLGYISEKEKATFLRNCEALLFPSFYEGFGLPVLEAVALGKPVITATNSSLVELNHPGIIFIDPFRPSDITSALHLIPKLRVGNLVPSTAQTWEKTVEKMHF